MQCTKEDGGGTKNLQQTDSRFEILDNFYTFKSQMQNYILQY